MWNSVFSSSDHKHKNEISLLKISFSAHHRGDSWRFSAPAEGTLTDFVRFDFARWVGCVQTCTSVVLTCRAECKQAKTRLCFIRRNSNSSKHHLNLYGKARAAPNTTLFYTEKFKQLQTRFIFIRGSPNSSKVANKNTGNLKTRFGMWKWVFCVMECETQKRYLASGNQFFQNKTRFDYWKSVFV